MVEVHFVSLLQLLAGRKKISLDVGQGVAVGELLERLGHLSPALERYLYSTPGNLLSDKVMVILNGRLVTRLEEKVKPGDRVDLMVPFCGG